MGQEDSGGTPNPEQPKFRIDFSYAWAYRTQPLPGRLDRQETEFAEALRSGQTIRLGFHFYPAETFGIGLKFNHFFTSHTDDITLFDDQTGQSLTGILTEKAAISFIGISGMGREKLSESFQLNYGLSLGLVIVAQEAEGFEQSINFDDSFAGAEAEFSLDYFLTEQLSVGIGAAFQASPFSGPDPQEIGPDAFAYNRIDLFGGFRINL